jgi:hypothetical protein
MRTDDFGREIASVKPKKPNMLRGGRLFTFGVALGAGLCLGMGPPLPLLDKAFSAAVAGEPRASDEPVMPRQWLALRNAVLEPDFADAGLARQRADEDLLRGKWLALRDALESSWSDRIAAR